MLRKTDMENIKTWLLGGFYGIRRKIRGQGLVEFALILPILLVTLFVIIEMARVLHAWMAIENGARTGVRYAVTGEYDPSNCNNGFTGDTCMFASDESEARVESIHLASWAGSSSIVRVGEYEAEADEPSFFKVIVCDPDLIQVPATTFSSHICPGSEDPGDPGDKVAVILEFNHPLILPGLSAIWPQLRLSARRDATVETFRVTTSSGNPPTVVAPPPPITNTPPATPTIVVPPGPECEKIVWKGWKWKSGRFYVLLQDTNVEDGYITSLSVNFPARVGGQDYYIDEIEWHPNAHDTGWHDEDMSDGNFRDPVTLGFSVSDDFWVSPNNFISRISVEFDGDLFDHDVPGGDYSVSVTISYPGFPQVCPKTIERTKSGVVATSTAKSGTSAPPESTLPFPATNTPPGPSTPIPPTDPPPTARD